jgi:hypothetical protein
LRTKARHSAHVAEDISRLLPCVLLLVELRAEDRRSPAMVETEEAARLRAEEWESPAIVEIEVSRRLRCEPLPFGLRTED